MDSLGVNTAIFNYNGLITADKTFKKFYQYFITFFDNDKVDNKSLTFSDELMEDWNLAWDFDLADELKLKVE